MICVADTKEGEVDFYMLHFIKNNNIPINTIILAAFFKLNIAIKLYRPIVDKMFI